MKKLQYELDDLGDVYELVDHDRSDDVYVRLLYRYAGKKETFKKLDLSRKVDV